MSGWWIIKIYPETCWLIVSMWVPVVLFTMVLIYQKEVVIWYSNWTIKHQFVHQESGNVTTVWSCMICENSCLACWSWLWIFISMECVHHLVQSIRNSVCVCQLSSRHRFGMFPVQNDLNDWCAKMLLFFQLIWWSWCIISLWLTHYDMYIYIYITHIVYIYISHDITIKSPVIPMIKGISREFFVCFESGLP